MMARIMSTQPLDTDPPDFLARLFGLKKHEYVIVAWSFVYFFCILSSYYILRPIRETMAVGGGPNTIPLLFLATFVVMLLATPIFGWVTSNYPRRKFLPWIYLFFICNILIFWAVFSVLIDDEQSHLWLGRVYFVWLSVFNLFIVSVFWSFMADIYTREQGRRLFGVIAAGGSIGGLLGAIATSALVVKIGFQNLFPFAAAMLAIGIYCIRRIRESVSAERSQEALASAGLGKPLGGNRLAGVTHMLSSPYFRSIAVSSVIASLLGTALYMFRAELVGQVIIDDDIRTQFFSNINIATSAIALVGQLFIVRHVVSRLGIGLSLVLMPIVSIVGFAALAFNPTLMPFVTDAGFAWLTTDPTLAAVAILIIIRRGLGFGVTKPTSDMLYSVVTPEEKYKTKNFIDTAIYRLGDLVGTWSIRGLTALGMGMSVVFWTMVPFAVIWSFIMLWLGRDYRRRAKLKIGELDS